MGNGGKGVYKVAFSKNNVKIGLFLQFVVEQSVQIGNLFITV